MNWPWKMMNDTCPVVIWDGEEGRLWAQAERHLPPAARRWFWQDRQQPLPQDLCRTDMRTVACILPCGSVRWHCVTMPPLPADECARMLAWEVTDWIEESDCPHWIWQSLPPVADGTGMTETVVGMVAEDVSESVRGVSPQGMKIRKIVPEEVAIGCALPVLDARVLRVRGDRLLAVSYRARIPVAVSVWRDASSANRWRDDGTPWYVVADDAIVREYWEERLQAQAWPLPPHHEYLKAGGTVYETYPQIVLGASLAACGQLCWTEGTETPIPHLDEWRERLPWTRLAAALGIVGLFAAAGGGYAYQTAADTLARADAATIAEAADRQELAALTAAQDALAQRQRTRNVWSKLLLIVADSRPDGVYLTELSEEGDSVVVKGVCLQQQALQEWKSYLQLRLQRHATVKYTHTQAQGEREFRLVLHGHENE